MRQLTAILSSRGTTLSPEQARLIHAEISALRAMRGACLADQACARQLKLVEKLLHRVEAHQRGGHEHKRGHPAHKHAHTGGASQASPGSPSHGGGPKKGHGHGSHGKGKKHP